MSDLDGGQTQAPPPAEGNILLDFARWLDRWSTYVYAQAGIERPESAADQSQTQVSSGPPAHWLALFEQAGMQPPAVRVAGQPGQPEQPQALSNLIQNFQQELAGFMDSTALPADAASDAVGERSRRLPPHAPGQAATRTTPTGSPPAADPVLSSVAAPDPLPELPGSNQAAVRAESEAQVWSSNLQPTPSIAPQPITNPGAAPAHRQPADMQSADREVRSREQPAREREGGGQQAESVRNAPRSNSPAPLPRPKLAFRTHSPLQAGPQNDVADSLTAMPVPARSLPTETQPAPAPEILNDLQRSRQTAVQPPDYANFPAPNQTSAAVQYKQPRARLHIRSAAPLPRQETALPQETAWAKKPDGQTVPAVRAPEAAGADTAGANMPLGLAASRPSPTAEWTRQPVPGLPAGAEALDETLDASAFQRSQQPKPLAAALYVPSTPPADSAASSPELDQIENSGQGEITPTPQLAPAAPEHTHTHPHPRPQPRPQPAAGKPETAAPLWQTPAQPSAPFEPQWSGSNENRWPPLPEISTSQPRLLQYNNQSRRQRLDREQSGGLWNG